MKHQPRGDVPTKSPLMRLHLNTRRTTPKRAKSPIPSRLILALLAAASVLGTATAQEPASTQRGELERVEQEKAALRQELGALNLRMERAESRLNALGQNFESFALEGVQPQEAEPRYGLGPSASKVYRTEHGVSIAGYGEFLYENREGAIDRFDALRAVLFVGYRFDENVSFNSEIEIEHGTTGADSGTTDEGGEVGLEFGYLDWFLSPEVGVRAGLLLVPVGLVNEMHEPTTYLASHRSQTERRIVPTTWRAPGVGLHGEAGGFAWRAYAMTSLDGERFDSSGLRHGRQEGNREIAEDFATALRFDWIDTPGLLVGASVWHGQTGQDGLTTTGTAIPDLPTTVLDVHFDLKQGPWWLRGMWANAFLDGASAFDTATGAGLAERMEGLTLEAGFDLATVLFPESGASLFPFVRFESIDTQMQMPRGVMRDGTKKDEIWTFGAHWRPTEGVVVKVDYTLSQEDIDGASLLIGYAF